MAKIHLFHVILGGNMSQAGRLENDHMRLMWDARKRGLIAVFVAIDEIFFLLQSPGKLPFPFALIYINNIFLISLRLSDSVSCRRGSYFEHGCYISA